MMKQSKQGKEKNEDVAKTSHSSHDTKTVNHDHTLMISQINRKITELLSAPPLESGLYLVATPIGNLSDISLRALAILSRVSAIYCEDTRHSRKLLTHYSIRQPLHPYHDHNADSQGDKLLWRIENGDSIALISDAGTPLISDPGYDLVKAAHERDIMVTSIPGPSAVITALSMAGMPTDTFLFAGFLPAKAHARTQKLQSLEAQPSTLIFYESPKRIHKALHDIAAIFPDRFCVIAKELTKLHETLYRGFVNHLINEIDTIIPKGEFVILIAPADKNSSEISDDDLLSKLASKMENASLRDSVQQVAKENNISKKRVYALGLSLKK